MRIFVAIFGLLAPNNVGISPSQRFPMLFSTTIDLEFLQSDDAMLAIDDHKPPILNQVPIFWFLEK